MDLRGNITQHAKLHDGEIDATTELPSLVYSLKTEGVNKQRDEERWDR